MLTFHELMHDIVEMLPWREEQSRLDAHQSIDNEFEPAVPEAKSDDPAVTTND
jgi:hypothetical protein